jgi:hypothetical protein
MSIHLLGYVLLSILPGIQGNGIMFYSHLRPSPSNSAEIQTNVQRIKNKSSNYRVNRTCSLSYCFYNFDLVLLRVTVHWMRPLGSD